VADGVSSTVGVERQQTLHKSDWPVAKFQRDAIKEHGNDEFSLG